MDHDVLIFHCAQPKYDADGMMILDSKGKVQKKNHTHTLVFDKLNDDTLIFGWAQAHRTDSYSKKLGREMAIDRLVLLRNRLKDFPNRKVHALESVTDQFLPKHVLDNSFDYYFNRAVTRYLDLNSINTVRCIFRSTDQDMAICEIKIDAEDIKESIEANIEVSVEAAKANSEFKSDIIFCTTYNNGALEVVIQNNKSFYDDGFDGTYTDETRAAAVAIVDLSEGLSADGNQSIIYAEDVKEYELILMIRALGISYDPNLESEFTNNED